MVDLRELRALRYFVGANVAITIAAVVATGVTIWMSSQTVNVARETLAEAKQIRDDQRSQFNQLRQGTADDGAAQQAGLGGESRYEVQRVNEARAEADRLERIARSPLLVQYQCCNPIAVVVERLSDGRVKKIRLPEENERRVFPAYYNRDHLISITNLGGGPAIGVSATWHPERGKLANGREFKIPARQHDAGFTLPMQLNAKEEAKVTHLPLHCYFLDEQAGDDRLAQVNGYLQLTCDDQAGERMEFKYSFSMTISCNEGRLGTGLDAGAMHFQIDETPRDARPSLEATPTPDATQTTAGT